MAHNEWRHSAFPLVPGHEFVGRVRAVGEKVASLNPGDLAGVGVMVDRWR